MAQRMIDKEVARRFIVVASGGAVFAGVVTLRFIFAGKFGLNLFNLLDVGLFFCLAYGIYRNSRTCAIVLLVYHLGNRFGMYQATGNLTHVFGLVPIAFAAVCFLGILGTFATHAIAKENGVLSAAETVDRVEGLHGQEETIQARNG